MRFCVSADLYFVLISESVHWPNMKSFSRGNTSISNFQNKRLSFDYTQFYDWLFFWNSVEIINHSLVSLGWTLRFTQTHTDTHTAHTHNTNTNTHRHTHSTHTQHKHTHTHTQHTHNTHTHTHTKYTHTTHKHTHKHTPWTLPQDFFKTPT